MVDNKGSINPQYHLPVSEAPIIDRKIPMSAFEFDSQFEDGVISSAKIRQATIGSAQIGQISFSQITGGTATLGGAGNGDGLLTVNNAGGTQVVRLDNTGIVITAGTISNVVVGTVNQTGGTITNAVIGTSQITGGTLTSALVLGGTTNAAIYKIGGTAGATGTITYLNAGTTLGTIVVQSGIITSIS
jgi:hypothetical protein